METSPVFRELPVLYSFCLNNDCKNTGSLKNAGEVSTFRAFRWNLRIKKINCKTRGRLKNTGEVFRIRNVAPPPLPEFYSEGRGGGRGKRFVFWKHRPYFSNCPGFTGFFLNGKLRRNDLWYERIPTEYILIHCINVHHMQQTFIVYKSMARMPWARLLFECQRDAKNVAAISQNKMQNPVCFKFPNWSTFYFRH